MKFGIICVVTLVVAALAANFLLQDPGAVVITSVSYTHLTLPTILLV